MMTINTLNKVNLQYLIKMQPEKAQAELKRHNELRAKHHAPPLVLSDWLNKRAQSWADNMAKTKKFEHSDCSLNGKDLGENIYWCSGAVKGGAATDSWYSEIKDHNYNDGESSWEKTGHFTQVVWKGSKEVGFGYSGGYVVGNYYPAGNMMGDFKNNVLKP